MAPCVSAPHESSGTSCSSPRDSSDRRRIKPTCGPLPWVTTTFQPAAIISAMWCIDSAAAAYWSGTLRCWPSLISELPPTATTAVWLTEVPSSRHRQRHHGLLHVQAILGLVVYHRIGPVDHLVGNFQVAVSRQAVHIDTIVTGQA